MKDKITERLEQKAYFGELVTDNKIASGPEIPEAVKPFDENKHPKFAVDYVKQQLFPDEYVK